MNKLFLLSLLFFLSPVFSSAQKSDQFIQYISKKIYNDCKGINIKIRNDSPLSFIQNNTQSFSFCDNNCVIKWPYNHKDIESLITTAISKEPYNSYNLINGKWESTGSNKQEYNFRNSQNESIKKIPRDGINILSCNDKILDISDNIYWWDGKIVEIPTVEKFTTNTNNFSFPLFEVNIVSFSIGISIVIFRKRIKKLIQRIWRFIFGMI